MLRSARARPRTLRYQIVTRGLTTPAARYIIVPRVIGRIVMSMKTSRNTAGLPRVSVGIPPSHLERLERIAATHERSVAWVVRHAVRLFLDEMDKGQLALDLDPSGEA